MVSQKISLYIPCYNASYYLSECLRGVFNQSLLPDEVIVVDDASVDGTAAAAGKFPVKVLRNPSNLGLAHSRNVALKHCRFALVASLDADCVPDRDWLIKLVKTIQNNGKIAGVGGRLKESVDTGCFSLWRAVHMKQNWGEAASDSVSFLFGSNNIFRKEIILKAGGYNSRYRNNYEDVDISERIRNLGYYLAYEPEAVTYHIKKDNLKSLFDTFWNWNFVFHEKKGYYRDFISARDKIEENIGLANRFLVDDIFSRRKDILYLDFILCFYLCIKDFLYIYTFRENREPVEIDRSFIPHLALLDLAFFYKFDISPSSIDTLLSEDFSFLQNLFAFILLSGTLIRDRFNEDNFFNILCRDLLSIFFFGEEAGIKSLAEKLKNLSFLNRDWLGFLEKKQQNLNTGFIKDYYSLLEKWLNSAVSQFPYFFDFIKDSQYVLKKGGKG
ncbi:MAG: glycosyltransferase [Candidatus Omnitrophica bacterium]|nr:glycosyltransferase [Candidatus Omnitrophota bacterium]MBD3268969.1 glycosyltransferase [Candidatus Omnitrophota bacterium]